MEPREEPEQQDQEEAGSGIPAELSANPGYSLGQIAHALSTQQTNPDFPTQQRAAQKIDNWLKVLQGMLSGAFHVGARTPVADTPAWVTLKVVQGGFVTGDLLAAGPLQPHEEELLARLASGSTAEPKAILNGYYLSDTGIAELQQRFKSGGYRVNVPEEGALLVFAWLLGQGQAAAAREMLGEITPFLSRLRFYPVPSHRPVSDSTLLHLQTVGETIQSLQAIKVPALIQAARESVLVWAPLSDRAIELFLETVEGPTPIVEAGSDNKPVQSAAGQWTVQGGWPCQNYPPGWQERGQSLLKDYERLRREHLLCGKPERRTENFTLLRGFLTVCLQDPKQLTGRDVGRIRSILAHVVTKRGLPGSERCQLLRQRQAHIARRPTRTDLAQVVISRLENLPSDEGLDTLEEVMAPVTEGEAGTYHLQPGQPVAEPLREKVQRCLAAPAAVLVEQKIIPSAEVLARIIPQITAQVSAAGIADLDLRRLYAAIYQAFRRRRSLLLLNLQSQVKLTELPWVKAMEAQRQDSLGTQEQARQTLEQVITLASTAFPQQILPNKLLQELRALAKNAGLSLPLVDEVAADIFMGAFSEKFLQAAKAAGSLLEGTLYERYYGLSYARVLEIKDAAPQRRGETPTSPAFFQLCSELAGTGMDGYSVARNGMVIEQEQILTTHNLAVLFSALGLAETLQPRVEGLAETCFSWICQRLQQPIPQWKARLQAVKNAAYAWRQMVFFLSLAPEGSADAFLVWATNHLQHQRPAFQERFRPALEGLALSVRKQYSVETVDNIGPDNAKRFLGWATGTHWLLR